ncbi:MAG: UDP-N-acetylmuramate--L-alanine ligase [Patescibacteria group bacterium]
MDLHALKVAHLVGAGGINMSAVGKLLLHAGLRVSGSDLAENPELEILRERGAVIHLGHAVANVPAETDVLIYSSAVPENNPERAEARRRGIQELTNFQFLGAWFKDKKTIVVSGTHGKSTTTAMLGLMLIEAGLDPTVIVGSKVPGFSDGNLRLGASDLFVVEGDEYARHFLDFYPYVVLVNNLELDHTDIYPTLQDVVSAFAELLGKIRPGGSVTANVGDGNVEQLIKTESPGLKARGIGINAFGGTGEWSFKFDSSVDPPVEPGDDREKHAGSEFTLAKQGTTYRFKLAVPGIHNAENAAGAALVALSLGAPYHAIAQALAGFKGIWRRFELLGDLGGVAWYSDYAHHPTAVAATLKAAHSTFPQARILLVYQPHHKKRTRSLFKEFIPSFDGADQLVLCEIYDVAGRDAAEDAAISSHDLIAAVHERDAAQQRQRNIEYAPDPKSAVSQAAAVARPGDIVIVMGAGDIDAAARNLINAKCQITNAKLDTSEFVIRHL